ncbi:SUMF1/EgtB/PvdO family nonheme iron enzyme [Fusobacterium polymorphum]|nr:AAA family ATPase [Fusobacterium polymorphum]UTI53643.1 SUMF1/EgtB/PvdO family nonheme iron enzyme [Fusobacterium polymorphum]
MNQKIIFQISGRDIIIKEKGQIIKKSSILEIIDFKEKIEDIGGLEGLKEWLKSKAQVFRRLDEAKKFGVDTPKGVLLVGMPGCGKSLAAKASARLFNVPLLRLDIGRLLGKYVGESEHNMRVALKTAESISPCILWIDEIEKAFAGINQDGGASDITKRLFGQFLTWLQEKENTVFVVATANDVTVFPPEFFRKGRFDEIFFIDFPNEEEREKIFKIHLEKRGKLNDKIDIKKLAKETMGYCGSDIEEVVKMTVETVFNIEDIENEEDSKLTTQDLLDSIKSIDSLSNILADKIKVLKDGYEKFKIKSVSKKIAPTQRIKEKFKVDKVLELDNMVFVRGGKYKPSFADEEKEVCNLEVCKYPTTQEMWLEIYKNNPSYFEGGKRPVEKVSWWNAIKFCNEMSKKYKLEPVYNITYDDFDKPILKINQIGESSVEPDKADFRKTEGFRLPTEVEWEWFARGGEVAIQDGTFDKKYSGSDNPDKVAWHNGNSEEETHEVGTKNPNQLGLYDCSGNVWEWCYDKASYCSAYYLRKGEKELLIKPNEFYKYDIKESGIRGEAWTTQKSYFSNGEGYMGIDEERDAVGVKKGGYYTKTCSYYSIGFRIVRTV